MPSVLTDLLGSTVRWAATLLVVYLVRRGIIPSGQSGDYVTRLAEATMAGLAMLAPLLWSYYQKLRAAVLAEAARRAEAGATEWQIREQASQLTVLDVLPWRTTAREVASLRADFDAYKAAHP